MISISDLLSPKSSDDVLETFLSELETLGLPARTWRKAGAYRSILRVTASMYAGFTQLQAQFIAAGFLETATGGWLTLLARNVFGVERPTATFATGSVTLTNTGGGVFTFGPNECTFKNPTTKKTYVNADPFALNPGDPPLTVGVRAVVAGSSSSSAPGEVTASETTLVNVTITNAEAIAGIDEQSDTDLRQTCRDKLAAVSVRGPRGAYRFAVLNALRGDGTKVNINRVQVAATNGVVACYAAAPSGAPISTDLDAARDNIENVARPDSVTATLAAATEVPVTRTLTLWARRVDGVSATDLQTAAQNALIAAFATYPVGGIPKPPSTQGYLYASFLEGVCKGSDDSIYDVDGASPDQALAPGEVATLAATVSVRIVDV